MSADVVKVRSITERVGSGDDSRMVTLNLGAEVPKSGADALPAARIKALRELGAIGPSRSVADLEAEAAATAPPQPPSPAPIPTRAEPGSPIGPPALDAVATAPRPGGDGDWAADSPPAPGPDGGSTPATSGSTDTPGPGTFDVASADVAAIAKAIDSQNLNAGQTVALAQGDPNLAAKVLEAERTASGGDGRSTVVKPLKRLAADAETPPTEGG